MLPAIPAKLNGIPCKTEQTSVDIFEAEAPPRDVKISIDDLWMVFCHYRDETRGESEPWTFYAVKKETMMQIMRYGLLYQDVARGGAMGDPEVGSGIEWLWR